MRTSDLGQAVAVDLGGTNVRAALIDRNLKITNLVRRPLDRSSPEALLEVMAACVAEAVADAVAGVGSAGDSTGGSGTPPGDSRSLGTIAGIGVAMKGFVDHRTGITVSSGYLGMKNIPVGPFLNERFGVPTYVANDVQSATIGEMFYGAGREHADFIYLNVGTGIAVGLVFGRRLYRGARNLSGEFGHITVDRNGEPCPCGRAGCLEHVVSGPGIIAQAQAMVGTHPDSRMAPLVESGELNATAIFALADAGDEAAVLVRDNTVAYLGDGIVNLVNVFNPEAIILGGGVFHNVPGFVNRLEDHVRTYSIGEAANTIKRFEVSTLEADKAGLIGAAGLVFEHDTIE